ncbi:putative reverse transcriptase zinc-binding domain-containing protein [Helianthus annuus]|nr:putative reverse transcriptase zinc-binding domain-containing protein [Helianthus annuus]
MCTMSRSILWTIFLGSLRSDVWRHINSSSSNLSNMGSNFGTIMRVSVGEVSDIRFWSHPWFGLTPLQHLFPNLYNNEKVKRCTISQRLAIRNGDVSTFNWVWKSAKAARRYSHEIAELQSLIQSYLFDSGADKWVWHKESNGVFTTSSCRKWVSRSVPMEQEVMVSWSPWSSLKIKCFVWKLARHRLPVREKLASRGINISSLLCPFCNLHSENIDHLFIECQFSKRVWSLASNWSGFNLASHTSVIDLLKSGENLGLPRKEKKVFEVVIYRVLWGIWRNRNEQIFKSKMWRSERLVEDIKLVCFEWLSQRAKGLIVDWNRWYTNPFLGL